MVIKTCSNLETCCSLFLSQARRNCRLGCLFELQIVSVVEPVEDIFSLCSDLFVIFTHLHGLDGLEALTFGNHDCYGVFSAELAILTRFVQAQQAFNGRQNLYRDSV